MIPVLAASAGSDGFATVVSVGHAARDGSAVVVEHEDLTVAWSTGCRWVDHHDDGNVLVVVDGRFHQPRAGTGETAKLMARRYRESGEDLARDALGDFVVVVLDRSRRRLVVARDPLGTRPWYHAHIGTRYAGASLESSVARLPWVDDAVDERTAIEHLAAVWESTGRTFHRGVETLAPGHTVTFAGRQVRQHRHHDWRLEPELDLPWDAAVERCRTLLDEVVADRLHGGGPPTSELSGGLDSSAVVGTAVGLGHHDLRVARLDFVGPAADERAWSDAVAQHWGLPMTTAQPWVPDTDEAMALSRALARPVPDPHFTMFAGLHRELLALGRPDGLTGLGGDDAFVTSSAGTLLVSALRLRRWPAVRDLVRAHGPAARDLWTGLARPALHHVARWRGRRLPGWVSADAAKAAELPATFRSRPAKVAGIDAIDERIANISSGYDASILEAQAIIADVEERRDSHPYLDPRFIEATYGLDPWWPRRGGHTRALQVDAYRDRLPQVIIDRRTKAEFSEIFWPTLLQPETLHRVESGPLADLGWLDLAGYERLIDHARTGMANAAIPLSRCVSLDRWLRTC